MEQCDLHAFGMKDPGLTIGYLTVDDPRDRRTWSGTNHFLLRALEKRARVVVLGPLRPQPVLFLSKALNFLTSRLLGRRFHYRDSFPVSKAYAELVRRRLAHERLDLIVAPAGLSVTALLRTDVPIVYVDDRCIAGALDYHEILTGLFAFSRKQSLALEGRALANASVVIYGSDWAADAARKAYPAQAAKIHVVPFGANLEQRPDPPAPKTFSAAPVKLLFLGVDWENKGGPIAYRTLLELKRRGHAAQLIVCGCTPPADATDPDLVREGFLDKNDPAQRKKLEDHLRTADFLVLPTRFEAYGIVFCEAAAYGLPALGTRTGGVPTIVQEGDTGHLFGLEEDAPAYADRIERLIADPAAWQRMRGAARQRYEAVLDWDVFVGALLGHASGTISKAR